MLASNKVSWTTPVDGSGKLVQGSYRAQYTEMVTLYDFNC